MRSQFGTIVSFITTGRKASRVNDYQPVYIEIGIFATVRTRAWLYFTLPPVPIRQLLISMGNTQHCRLFKRSPGNLQANRQAICREATGERYGGQTRQVEGHSQAQQRRCCVLRDTINADLLVGLFYENGRDGQCGQYQRVDLPQYSAHTV